jgi:hypothetical protein
VLMTTDDRLAVVQTAGDNKTAARRAAGGQ